MLCLNGWKQVKLPGKCCYECQGITARISNCSVCPTCLSCMFISVFVCVIDSVGSCSYLGTVYHSNEQWEVDECTSCTCVHGDVHCHSERCPPITCSTVSITNKHKVLATYSSPLVCGDVKYLTSLIIILTLQTLASHWSSSLTQSVKPICVYVCLFSG